MRGDKSQSYSLFGYTFNVFLAKKSFELDWESYELGKIVRSARESYQVYGDVPIEDEYDYKSDIYVTQVIGKTGIVSYYSARFIAAVGEPPLSDDLDIFYYHSSPIFETIKKEIFKGDYTTENYLDRIYTISRLCKVKEASKSAARTPRWILIICVAVMLESFLSRVQKHIYLSGVFHPALFFRGSLNGGIDLSLEHLFDRASDTLGIAETGISIERNLLSYRYPLYFLDSNEIIRLLRRLLSESLISKDTILEYFSDAVLDIVTEKKMTYNISDLHPLNMEKMVNENELMKFSKLNGDEFKTFLDSEISDLPFLTLTDSTNLKMRINNIIRIITDHGKSTLD